MERGRPSLYDPSYCAALISYFDRSPFVETEKTITTAKGTVIVEKIRLPAPFPSLAGFARMIGVHRDTIHAWASEFPDFSDAIARAKDIQEDILLQNGLLGLYAQPFAVLVAKNFTGMRDKVEHEGLPKDGSRMTITHEGSVTLSPSDTLMEMLRQGPPALVGQGRVIEHKP